MKVRLYVTLSLLGATLLGNSWADSSGPVMRLFPTTLLEDIRETSQVAEDMENDLQEIIHRMDMQRKLYEESLCNDADADPGCDRMAGQIGATYLEMLNAMNERLPEMERAVTSTRNALQKRINAELGKRTTPTSLQEQILGKTSTAAARAQPALRGSYGVRMSDRIKQYYNLVATHNNGPNHSMAVVAADIYLDMDETVHLIAATQEQINRAAMMERINQSFGAITPEMAAVVDGVKAILFGESSDIAPIAAPPVVPGPAEFVSPLEI